MTKKALLVGSSFSAVPIFFKLKERGYHVSVCGSLANDPCHQYSDASFFTDYSDRDALLQIAEAEHFDCLVPSCNDFSYLSCAWVAERLGFPGFDSHELTRVLHTKRAFRELLAVHRFPSPRSSQVPEGGCPNCDDLSYPVLVKPVDSFSGRGVSEVSEPQALATAVAVARKASRSGEVIMEEFIEGRLFSHSAFVRQKKIVADFFVDEFCTLYPYQVNCSNHPSSLQDEMKSMVRKTMGDLTHLLGLQDGLLHTQFIANEHEFWIVECMRRCPGDLYGHLIELSTGVCYTDFFVRPFVGDTVPEVLANEDCLPVGRHTISTAREMIFQSFTSTLHDINLSVVPLKNSGEKLNPAPFDKVAVVFAQYPDEQVMAEVTPRFAEHIVIQGYLLPEQVNRRHLC